MNPMFNSAFITCISNVFTTMLQLPVEAGEPAGMAGDESPFDVEGVVEMSGDVSGSVALCFTAVSAERIVALFAGESMTIESEDFPDAIGELVNMVAGGAKGMFDGRAVRISCPRVIVGQEHGESACKGAPCVLIPCSTDCGQVVIKVALVDHMRATNTPTEAAPVSA